MGVRLLKFSLVVLALFPASPVFSADPADDPLPEGAKVRFGVTRPILQSGPSVDLLPPRFTNLLAPTIANGVRRYDLGTGRPLDKGGAQVGPGRVTVSADGRRAAVARPGTLTVVDVVTRRSVLAVRPPTGVLLTGVPGVSLSADGTVLAYGGRGKDGKGEVVVWDVDKDEELARVATAQAAPVFPTLSRDGKTLVTHGPPLPAPALNLPNSTSPSTPSVTPPMPAPAADPDAARTAQVWEVKTGKELFKARVTGMGGMVVAAAFSPDGNRLALSAGDGPVDVLEVETGKRVHTLLGRKGQGVRVAFSPDGRTVATVGPDYRIQRWTADGKPFGVTDPPPGVLVAQVTGLAFADNERVVAWVTAAQFVVAWEAPTGRLLTPVVEHAAAIQSIAFADGEKDLFTSGFDGHVFRWDLPTGLMNERVTLHPARLPAQPLIRPNVALSADATRATWTLPPGEVFDVASGADLFCVPAPSAPPSTTTIGVSPDGMKAVTVAQPIDKNRPGSSVVWDLATQQRVIEVEIPRSPNGTPAAVLNHEGTRLVVASAGRSETGGAVLVVTGWDLKTGKKLGEVEDAIRASGRIHVTAVGESSAVLVSSTGRIWAADYAAGRVEKDIDKLPVRGLLGETMATCPAVFSADGKRFAVGVVGERPETYGVRVYDWRRRTLLHTATGHLGPVTALRFSPDGKFLASGSQDTSVLLWDLAKLPAGK